MPSQSVMQLSRLASICHSPQGSVDQLIAQLHVQATNFALDFVPPKLLSIDISTPSPHLAYFGGECVESFSEDCRMVLIANYPKIDYFNIATSKLQLSLCYSSRYTPSRWEIKDTSYFFSGFACETAYLIRGWGMFPDSVAKYEEYFSFKIR